MQKLPLVLILVGIGTSLISFIFGQPANPYAGLRVEVEDMRVFGIAMLQFRWILAGSICLILIGLYLQFRKEPQSN